MFVTIGIRVGYAVSSHGPIWQLGVSWRRCVWGGRGRGCGQPGRFATLGPFSAWLECVCVVTFDLELGQAIEVITILRSPLAVWKKWLSNKHLLIGNVNRQVHDLLAYNCTDMFFFSLCILTTSNLLRKRWAFCNTGLRVKQIRKKCLAF